MATVTATMAAMDTAAATMAAATDTARRTTDQGPAMAAAALRPGLPTLTTATAMAAGTVAATATATTAAAMADATPLTSRTAGPGIGRRAAENNNVRRTSPA